MYPKAPDPNYSLYKTRHYFRGATGTFKHIPGAFSRFSYCMLEKGAFLFHFNCEKTWFLDKNFFHIVSKCTLEGALHEKSTSGLEEGAF